MWSMLWSGSLQGLHASLVRVEVDLQSGLPSFCVVGLPDAAIRESKERVRSALKNDGFLFPMKRITVNLAPAHLKKEGSSFELAIALSLIMANENWDSVPFQKILFLGELSLKGELNGIRGILPLILEAKQHHFDSVLVPVQNVAEASLVEGIHVYGIRHLHEAAQFLKKELFLSPVPFSEKRSSLESPFDMSEVKGQRWAKKALEISAAGGHHLLMVGPPGCGKSMLAKRLPTLVPPLNFEESLEVCKIYSVSGLLDSSKPISSLPPFRSPHHTISCSALVGGGTSKINAGEISLSHHGILFLDELPEFRKDVLEALREPLEEKTVSVCRVRERCRYPADFLLVAAMNPCPCGYWGDPHRECLCGDLQIEKYQHRISGPLLDRIDIHVMLSRVTLKEVSLEKEESSKEILARVVKARERQQRRFKKTSFKLNAQIHPKEISQFCRLTPEGERVLHQVMEKFGFSYRTYHRLLKISRTLSDLEEEELIRASDIAQALQLRFLDRQRFSGSGQDLILPRI